MHARIPARILIALALGGGLALTGQVPASTGQSPPGFRSEPAGEVLRIGTDRVQVATVGTGERRALTPLPREDGTTPGLVISEAGGATTLRTFGGTEPVTIEGHPQPPASAASEDLVELRLEAIGRDGRPSPADVSIFDVETGAVAAVRMLPADDGAACTTATLAVSDCILVPPGSYSVLGMVSTMPAALPSVGGSRSVQNISLVGDPELLIAGDHTVTLDAREAQEMTVTTRDRRSQTNPGGVIRFGFTRTADNGKQAGLRAMPPFLMDERVFVQPTAAVEHGTLDTLTRLRLEAPDIELVSPRVEVDPDYVDRVWFSDVASEFPVFDGQARVPVVDAGRGTPDDLAGLDLHGALALIERSDAIPVADQSNAAAAAGARLVAVYNDIPGDSNDPGAVGTMLEVPTLRLSRAEGLALRRLPGRPQVTVRGESASPYVYDLILEQHGRIPAEPSFVVRDRDLTRQQLVMHGQPTVDATFSDSAYPFLPGETISASRTFPFRDGPRTRVEYRMPDPEVRWTFAANTPEMNYNNIFPNPPLLRMSLATRAPSVFTGGSRTALPAGRAPIAAAPNPDRPVERTGNRLVVAISGFSDADGRVGSLQSHSSGVRTHFELRADGVVLGETDASPSGFATLPEGESLVSLHFTATNPQEWAELSTHTDTEWVFGSDTADGPRREPLVVARWDADVDLRNRLAAGPDRRAELALDLGHAPGSGGAAFETVSVEASYDDGQTWRRADLTQRRGRYDVVLPRGTGYVSLRLHAADVQESELRQTIIRALHVTQ